MIDGCTPCGFEIRMLCNRSNLQHMCEVGAHACLVGMCAHLKKREKEFSSSDYVLHS